MDEEYSADHKRKFPVGIRPEPGHVPSTVFNNKSSLNREAYAQATAYAIENHQSQKRAQAAVRVEEQRKDRAMLNSYDPWGKPGGGAPRNAGAKITNLSKNLDDADVHGSIIDHLNKPGCGAPYRTESGNPSGCVKVHSDIRASGNKSGRTSSNNFVNGNYVVTNDDSGNYRKPQILGGREKTNEDVKVNLKERLERQIDEKRVSIETERIAMKEPEKEFWIKGQVGYVKRDNSGKICRPTVYDRDATGIRQYVNNSQKGIVDQLGRPGPGVPRRTDSGNFQSQPRGKATSNDDPFRPGRLVVPAKDVFPATIEDEAQERAWKRHPSNMTPPLTNKHTVENGYYQNDQGVLNTDQDPRYIPQKPISTVYSAIVRSKNDYLGDLRRQIDEKNEIKTQQKRKLMEDEYKHIQSSDFFGRPGNGAPRLQDGHLNTGRTRLYELETISDGIRNPGAFRGLH